MNLEQIRNPHLIYPGQVLVLVKSDGRAMLQGRRRQRVPRRQPVRCRPRVRSELLANGAIAAIPLHLIGPFLNEAVVFTPTNWPRTAHRGHPGRPRDRLTPRRNRLRARRPGRRRDFRLFRQPRRWSTRDTAGAGLRGHFVGTAEFVREGGTDARRDSKGSVVVPSTFRISNTRLEEVGVGDRLSPVPPSD
jgi:hypothetical protein